ncbi:hypothetical protein [Sphingomonas sp. TREG-RG-20F-R18-01]|uniref:hypothetical protein n=1 Tax=Sphingomonas sp. TREG-RG-20F-R18-01 TaxID=2914982 RepID=UPI001F56F3C4|nr:hypothetical protein [Sphingomonas sp. TREG-RG-20F-R18-01]
MKTALGYVAVAALFAAAPASAAQFNFTFTTTSLPFGGSAQNGSGIFTTSDTAMTVEGRNAFAITGIAGQINNVAISGLTEPRRVYRRRWVVSHAAISMLSAAA